MNIGSPISAPPNKKTEAEGRKDTTLVESVSREWRLTLRSRRPELKRIKAENHKCDYVV